MKKILFGSVAALCAVAGFSSFKATKSSTNWVYFPTTATAHLPKGAKPLDVFNAKLQHDPSVVIVNTPGTHPSASACTGSSFLCYAAFPSTAVAITASGDYFLKTVAAGGGINAISFAFTKS